MTSRDKIQHLLITHLLKEGQIDLALPTGVKLSLGITKETKKGLEKCDDYLWLIADQDDRHISLDSYNLGIQFDNSRIMIEEQEENHCVTII